jgi:KUP system potassium uptake protein
MVYHAGSLGVVHIADELSVLKAFNPYYAIKLLSTYPKDSIFLVVFFFVLQVLKLFIQI